MMCKRDGCSVPESRINGYCSCHCEDVGLAEEQIKELEEENTKLRKAICIYASEALDINFESDEEVIDFILEYEKGGE